MMSLFLSSSVDYNVKIKADYNVEVVRSPQIYIITYKRCMSAVLIQIHIIPVGFLKNGLLSEFLALPLPWCQGLIRLSTPQLSFSPWGLICSRLWDGEMKLWVIINGATTREELTYFSTKNELKLISFTQTILLKPRLLCYQFFGF